MRIEAIAAPRATASLMVNPPVRGLPVMIAASLHLAATLPACPPAREPRPYVQEPVMEFDRMPNAISESLDPG